MKASLRTLLGAVLVGALVYGGIVFGGFAVLAANRVASLRAEVDPLRTELIRLDRLQQQLDSLAVAALELAPGDTAGARILSSFRPEEEGAAVRSQRRVSLPGEIRSALARMAPAESELLVRIREFSAAIELQAPLRTLQARENLLEARAQLANATRRVELLALQDLSDREARLDDDLSVAQRILVVAGAVGLLFVILGYRILDRRLLKPVEEIGRAVEDVRGGDFSRTLEPRFDDEIGRVAQLFNQMTRTLLRRSQEETALRASIAQELRRSEDLFQEVVNQAREIILVLDGDGKILLASPAWRSLGGLPSDPRGELLPELLPTSAGRALRRGLRELEELPESRVSVPLDRRVDGPGTFEFLLTPLDRTEGRVLAIARDVTETMAEEERLRRSSRLEAVGQLTGGVAHDFNNLLTVIRGNLDLLRETLPDSADEVERLLQALEHASDRAAGLTQSLLAFARRQTLRTEALDLGEGVRHAVSLLDRVLTEEIRLVVETPDTATPVELDRTQLESAIINLCINARDAMPRGGTIYIGVSETLLEGDEAEESELSPGPFGVVEVRDTGTGMSPEVLGKALEPFFTTKEVGQGSGLGLSMVYGFTRQSGGTLRLASREGMGTTVTLLFPLVGDVNQVRTAPEEEDRSVPRAAGQTVLVVEDDPDVRAIVVAMLRDLGYQTVEAETAAEGLERAREATFDLLFSDVVLPGGMDGAALGREVRELRPGVPVLLTSGYPREALADREGIESVELLPKPYDRGTLARAIRNALEGRPVG